MSTKAVCQPLQALTPIKYCYRYGRIMSCVYKVFCEQCIHHYYGIVYHRVNNFSIGFRCEEETDYFQSKSNKEHTIIYTMTTLYISHLVYLYYRASRGLTSIFSFPEGYIQEKIWLINSSLGSCFTAMNPWQPMLYIPYTT